MPPARKKAAKSADAATRAPVALLLSRCKRGALEDILAESVQSGQPVTYERIKRELPEAQHSTAIARTKVDEGQAREGTGLFDLIDDEILCAIIANIVSTQTRLGCAVAVCKAWRSVLKQAPIFTCIGMYVGQHDFNFRTNGVRISSSNVERLVSWLPDVGAVHTLKIDVGDKHASLAPDVTKRALPRFTGLTSLALHGKKVTPAVLTVLAKQRFAANLVSFELGDCQAKANDAIGLLRQAVRLESLKLNFGYEDAGGILRTLASAWSVERGGGGASLLRSLETTGWSSSCKIISFSAFVDFPELFPEIETLHCSFRLTGVVLPDLKAIRPNLRLRELTLHALVHSFGQTHLTTHSCGASLRAIFAAVPNLEKLSIDHGEVRVSNRAYSDGFRKDPLPGVDGALAELPASVVTLSLGHMTLASTDLDMHPGLPALKSLILDFCGPQMIAFAEAAVTDRGKCPQLESKHVKTRSADSLHQYRILDAAEEARVQAALAAAKEKRDAAGRSAHGQTTAPAAGGSSATAAGGNPDDAGPSGSRPESSPSRTDGAEDFGGLMAEDEEDELMLEFDEDS